MMFCPIGTAMSLTLLIQLILNFWLATSDDKALQHLERRWISIICLAGFMRILSGGFVRRFYHRILNIHPSLLPQFKGAHAIQDALNAGVKEAGCTVHYVSVSSYFVSFHSG